MNFFNNNPQDLTVEGNDFLDVLPKANAIKDFFESFHPGLGGNKMFVLYGGWGTGKSSLLKYLSAKIDSSKYDTVFFEAWQNEKDENLPLSLAYELSRKIKSGQGDVTKAIQVFKTEAFSFLKCFLKGTNLKLGNGLIGVDISGNDMLNAAETELKEIERLRSFTDRLNSFKEAFVGLEDEILGKDNDKHLIVFIDDLDRCETENVLELLSAIKLFFTYGKRTVFVCGVDKDATKLAIKAKYNDTIKADEYLEKVFDISWKMPHQRLFNKYVGNAFPRVNSQSLEINEQAALKILDSFFVYLEFTNPRHIKKILNKYNYLRFLKENVSTRVDYLGMIPEIIQSDGNGKLIDTLFTLFLVIMYEFNYDEFEALADYNSKLENYSRSLFNRIGNGRLSNKGISSLPDAISWMNSYLRCKDLSEGSLKTVFFSGKQITSVQISLLTPSDIEFSSMPDSFNNSPELFLSMFDKNHSSRFQLGFCKFLIDNYSTLKDLPSSDTKFVSLFEMCRTLL